MRRQNIFGIASAVSCLMMPFLCRIPRGSEWVAQYLPGDGMTFAGSLFILAFSAIPAVVVFCAAQVSKPRYYLPVLASAAVALLGLANYHSGNDLTADAQSAISLVIIPFYVSGPALIAAIAGYGVQYLAMLTRTNAEQDVPPKSDRAGG